MDETKKYIIEFSEDPHTIRLMKIKNGDEFPTTEFKTVTPYTEDSAYAHGYTEAESKYREIRDELEKQAYEKGVQDTKQHWVDAPRSCAYKLGYENGLNDLWEAMQKAIKMYCEIDNEVYLRVFYDVNSDWGDSVLQALFKKTPQQLIDSMRKYDESKEKHTWICSEVNEPSVDTTLICSECGYTITIKPGDTQALNFCPKCGDNKNPGREKKNEDPA